MRLAHGCARSFLLVLPSRRRRDSHGDFSPSCPPGRTRASSSSPRWDAYRLTKAFLALPLRARERRSRAGSDVRSREGRASGEIIGSEATLLSVLFGRTRSTHSRLTKIEFLYYLLSPSVITPDRDLCRGLPPGVSEDRATPTISVARVIYMHVSGICRLLYSVGRLSHFSAFRLRECTRPFLASPLVTTLSFASLGTFRRI